MNLSAPVLYFALFVSSPAGAQLDCAAPFPKALNFELVRKKIETCDLKTIESLLERFPVTYLTNYTLMHSSRSLQSATPEAPRAILYGDDAKFIASFNGDRSHPGNRDLEIIQFRDETKSFEFRTIRFPEDPGSAEKATISEANPQLCMNCHRQTNPRPIWDGYFLWPGAYGAEDDAPFRPSQSPLAWERENYARFSAQAHAHGRYRFLKPHPKSLPNTGLGLRLHKLNMESIARSLGQNPRVRPYRYALAAIFTCDDLKIDEYFPASARADIRRHFDEIRADTRIRQTWSFNERIGRIRVYAPACPEEPRVRSIFRQVEAGTRPSATESDVETAALRLIGERLLSLPVKEWSLEFGGRGYSFWDGNEGIRAMQKPFVNEFFSDEQELFIDFQPYYDPRTKIYSRYRVPVEKLCAKLRSKSRNALTASTIARPTNL